MLVLSRKVSEKLMIGDDISITVTRISKDKVRLAVDAPDDVRVLRSELIDRARNTSPVNEDDGVSLPVPENVTMPRLTEAASVEKHRGA